MKLTFKNLTCCFFCALIICSTIITACRKSFFDRPETHLNKTHNEYVVDYQSTCKDSILRFTVEITKKGQSTVIVNEAIEIDLKGNRYLKTINQDLKQRSLDQKYSILSLKEARDICISLREAITDHSKSLTPEQLKNPNIQGMHMSLAFTRHILKNKLGTSKLKSDLYARKNARSSTDTPVDNDDEPTLSQPSYAQDVFEGYEVGLSAFVMNEDIIVNKQVFLNIVNQDIAATAQDDQGLYVFQHVLNNITSNSFTLKDMLSAIDAYVSLHPENIASGSGDCLGGWWPTGHSHGCCGNYSGCCWYWHPACYIHDKMCINCKPRWFCFSGCVPGDDTPVDPPKPFTFVEDAVPDPGAGLYMFMTNDDAFEGVFYTTSYNDIFATTPHFFTTIYLNPADKIYYSDEAHTTLVPDGYYDSPKEIVNNTHKYYHIVNGIALQIYTVVRF